MELTREEEIEYSGSRVFNCKSLWDLQGVLQLHETDDVHVVINPGLCSKLKRVIQIYQYESTTEGQQDLQLDIARVQNELHILEKDEEIKCLKRNKKIKHFKNLRKTEMLKEDFNMEIELLKKDMELKIRKKDSKILLLKEQLN
jgi:hypothetical protein